MKKHTEILENFKTYLLTVKDEKKRVEEILEFCVVYGDSYGEGIVPLLEEAMQTSTRIGYKTGEFLCYYNLLFFHGRTQGLAGMEKYENSAKGLLEITEAVKEDAFGYSLALNLLAFYHWFRGDYEKGFNYAFAGVKHGEHVQDKSLGWNYFALGVFYFDTKDLENSELYYQKALTSFEGFDYPYGIARASNGIASVSISQKKIEKAALLLETAASIYRDLGHYSGLSRALNDMALIEKEIKNYTKAITLFNESIELRKEINHIQGLITSITELGEIYLEMNDDHTALNHLSEALVFSYKADSKQKTMRLHKLIYETQKKLNNLESALYHLEQFYELKNRLLGDEATNSIKRLQTNFEKEKSEKIAEVERLKNVELTKAYEIIEQKNKDIHDSINYASRIQRSLLPTEKYLERLLTELKANEKGN